MSAPPTTQPVNPASATPPASAAPAPASPQAPPAETLRSKFAKRLWLVVLVSALAVVAIAFIARWGFVRATSSITDDAFIEAHIVNVAPQAVSGHLVRFLVEENDHVEQGQLLAEIDPLPYRDQVELARSKVDAAQVELKRQQAALERLKLEVPIQVEISRRTLAAAHADQARAKEALKLTGDSVEKGIEEAQAGLAAAKADSTLAEQEYTRFSTLYKQDAVPLRRSQEVTRSRDAAEGLL